MTDTPDAKDAAVVRLSSDQAVVLFDWLEQRSALEAHTGHPKASVKTPTNTPATTRGIVSATLYPPRKRDAVVQGRGAPLHEEDLQVRHCYGAFLPTILGNDRNP